MYKRALVSVSDKTGLEDFLKPLVKQGLKLVSTGGTAQFLKSKDLKVKEVKDLTSFPPALSGRVKSLHPYIFIPLLARHDVKEDQEVLQSYKIETFDLLIVNLYPFETKASQLSDKEKLEWIDVGGPSLLRAGAKNYPYITTLCDPKDYSKAQKGTDLNFRKQLAVKAFKKLSQYDWAIAENLKENWLNKTGFSLKGSFFKKLRYGENPHQTADWFKVSKTGLHSAQMIQGKELSYNNILDFDKAVQTVRDFKKPCVVAIKHNNPCGAAIGETISLSLKKALKADPMSVFGGLLAFNQAVDTACAEQLTNIFLEGLIAPDFSKSALNILQSKKNLRILKWGDMLSHPLSKKELKEVMGGFLLQSADEINENWDDHWKIIGQTPTADIKQDIIFAWKVCAHLKSNAISIVKEGQTLGLGMGQVNRIDAVRLALNRKNEFHPQKTENLILASDAFFPFSDSIELAKRGGVCWIIQPGGSIKDKEVLKKSLQLKLNMILTGQRHFKH